MHQPACLDLTGKILTRKADTVRLGSQREGKVKTTNQPTHNLCTIPLREQREGTSPFPPRTVAVPNQVLIN